MTTIEPAKNHQIKLVSFDAEGTLVTPDFSSGMWYECIPEYYGKKKGISFDEARQAVADEYDRVGDGRLEWYDARYWFERFELGDYRDAFERCRTRICYYPEVAGVLSAVGGRYPMIIISASIREFLEHLVADISGQFERIVSSISDYSELKTPAFYSRVCRDMGVLPEEIVHVGDNRQYDFVNAGAAGIRSFHLDRQGTHGGPGTVRSLAEFSRIMLDS